MRVRGERDTIGRIVQQPREPAPHLVRLLECLLPYVINEFGCVEPSLLLRLERDVRPCLMGVTREQNAFGDTKATVVRGELFGVDHDAERRRRTAEDGGGITTRSELPKDQERRTGSAF